MTVWFFAGDSFDWIEALTTVTGVPRVSIELFLASQDNAPYGQASRLLPCVLDNRTDCGLSAVDPVETVTYFTSSRNRADSGEDAVATAPPERSAGQALRSPRRGDFVLFTGVVWTNFYAEVFMRLVACGIKYCVLLYDIIPLERPDLVSADHTRRFGKWLRVVVETAAVVFVSSHANKDMLLKWAALEGLTIKSRIVVVTFGSTNLTIREAKEGCSALVGGGAVDRESFVLSVGTLDRRKNQTMLCRVWLRLISELGHARVPQLVLAGRNDLPADQFDLKAFGGKVVNLQGLSDSEIGALYDGCLFTVFPSLCEGYGLPVAESLAHGKVCVASDLPPIREHAGDLIWYFDPTNEETCYDKICSAIARDDLRAAAERRIVAEYEPPSWGFTCNAILEEIETVTDGIEGEAADTAVPSRASGALVRQPDGSAYAANPGGDWLVQHLKKNVGWLIFFLCFFGIAAARLGPDATPDFRIYHHYNGFAVFHDRTALDIFPAQLQTAFFPGLDALYYWLSLALNDRPILLNIILSLPYGAAAFGVFGIARICSPPQMRGRTIACAAAGLMGLTGVAALPTLSTTMSDVVPGVPFLLGLMLWLFLERAGRNTVRTALAAGALCGLSVGLKLTLAGSFVGMFGAIALRHAFGERGAYAYAEAFAFGAAGTAAFLVIDASWLWHNYQNYQNAIFPFANDIFNSDLVAHSSWRDLRFMPKSVMMALFYPAYWAFWTSHDTIELNMRDPRILVGCTGALIILVAFAVRRWRYSERRQDKGLEPIAVFLAITYLISYVIWESMWSIYRYLTVPECLSGVILLLALLTIFRSRAKTASVLICFLALAAMSATATQYPWWSRAQRGPRAVAITLPPIEKNAMVLFLDPYAYSYLVPSMPETVRAIGANTNLTRPGSPGKLQSMIGAAIRGHRGPLWGMEYPEAFPGVADFTLQSYGLARTSECSYLDTNIEERRLVRICRLERK